MNYIGGPFIGPEPHHHHHGPSPVELAQISGASQYARLNTRLQKHIEDDVRHITDEERYKWNKGIYDLKALKEDINDGTIGGGGLDKDELALYLTTHKYATQDWVEGKGYQTESQVNWLITTWFETKFGTADFGKLAKLSDLEGYVKKGSLLGQIDGKDFYQGGSITTNGGNGGLSWDDLKRGLTYNPIINSSTAGAERLGEVKVNGETIFTIWQTDNGGGGGTIPIATTSRLGGIIAGSPYTNNEYNATRYGVQVSAEGIASVVIPNAAITPGEGGDSYNWIPFFCLYASRSSENAPQLPNPSNGVWSYTTHTWDDVAPESNDTEYVWMCWCEQKNGAWTGAVNGPVCLGADAGADANGMEFVYRQWPREDAVGVVGKLHDGTTYNGKTPSDEDYVPEGWSDHPNGISSTMPVEYMAYRVSRIVNGKRVWQNNFSEPYIWSKWGRNGMDGDGIEFIFSAPVDMITSQATMKSQLETALSTVFGRADYENDERYQAAIEIAELRVNNAKLEDYGWYDDAQQLSRGKCTYVSIRKKHWDANEETGVWGRFSDPVIWSTWMDATAIIEGGSYYTLDVNPSQIHVDAVGVADATDIYVKLTKHDSDGSTELKPGSEDTDYLITYKFSNSNDIHSFADADYVGVRGYRVSIANNNAASITFSATNLDSVPLCQSVTVSKIVDGSVTTGVDSADIIVQNGTMPISCDSDYYVMRNLSGQQATIKAYVGGPEVSANLIQIKYNNTRLYNNTAVNVQAVSNINSQNTIQASATLQTVDGELKIAITTNLPSTKKLDDSYTIPFTATFTVDGTVYVRPFFIQIQAVPSGTPGAPAVEYKLIVNKQSITVDKNSSGQNVFNDTAAITGTVYQRIGDETYTALSLANMTNLSLRAIGTDLNASNAQAGVSVFTYNGTTWTFNPSAAPSGLYNRYGSHFLIQLGNSNFSVIYDQEEINFVINGKDGQDGVGQQGLQGCVVRESLLSDGESGTKYRNDSNWTTTSRVRYIDVIGVPSSTQYANEDGFEWFAVKPSAVVSSVENSGCRILYWSQQLISALTGYVESNHSASTISGINIPDNFEVLTDVGGIYSSFILAKNAKIKFQTSNELTIVGRDNSTIVAGLTGGGNATKNVRIWAGSTQQNLNDAPFRVYDDGSLVATSATIYGSIIANEGRFTGELEVPNGGLKISSNGRGSIAGGRIWWDENGVYIQDYTLIGGDNTGDNGSTPSGSSSGQQVQVTNQSYRDNGDTVTADITIKNQTGKRVYGYVDVWICSSTYKMSMSNIMVPVWRAEESKPFDIPANETSKPFTYTIPKTSPLFDDFTPGIDTDKSFAWVPRYTEGVTDNSVKRWSNMGIWDD